MYTLKYNETIKFYFSGAFGVLIKVKEATKKNTCKPLVALHGNLYISDLVSVVV